MADIDLRALPDNEFVLHFGGRPSEVNAFTFANTLIAISEAIQEINRQINPDFNIEIAIDGVGAGCFRARFKTASKSIAGLFAHRFGEPILIGLLTTYIGLKIWPQDQMKIIINDDSYIIEQAGGDRLILPKGFGDAHKRITDQNAIDKHLARAFDVLQEDPSVTDFGFAADVHGGKPFAVIPQSSFAQLAQPGEDVEDDVTRYVHTEHTKVIVLKIILERGHRRWQFVWNGVKISAPITSVAFSDKLASREYEFGQGDVLDVTLRITRVKDEMSGAFVNEKYEISEVHGLEKSLRQTRVNLPPKD